MMKVIRTVVGLLPLAATAATIGERQLGPTVQIQYGTVVGSSTGGVDSFKGIPYALPPVGQLRLKPPQPVTKNLGTVIATGIPRACPQFYQQVNTSSLPSDTVAKLSDSPLVQTVTDSGEDCLTINVQRPSSATKLSKLPVVFWIYGGAFEFGSTQAYDATTIILSSITKGKPIIYVSVNYRVGGFGFLPGSKILKDGSANLGLLDQRLALQWVADNIANFGGDPSKVTIWGESAGAISVFDQMALYDGNTLYNGKPLFRAAIMDSGSVIPADPVDCPKSEVVYNTVVQNAGCSGAADTLSCLRSVDYTTYLNAANSVPGFLGYQSVALSYLPRPDGTVLTKSPDVLAKSGAFAQVPFIIGDQEDEGTIFSLSQSNITTTNQLIDYFCTYYFLDATRAQITNLVSLYPDDPTAGSPFRTGLMNNIYPQYKRLAALLGDLVFTLSRRIFLAAAASVHPNVPSWSYLSSYFYGLPVLGTFHASDILKAYGTPPDPPTVSVQAYYISFINDLDPNASSGLMNWPMWSQGKQLMNFNAAANVLIPDTFRDAAAQFLAANIKSLHI